MTAKIKASLPPLVIKYHRQQNPYLFGIVFAYRFDQKTFAFGIAISNYLLVISADAFHKLVRSFDIGLSDIQMVDFLPFALAASAYGDSFLIGEEVKLWIRAESFM